MKKISWKIGIVAAIIIIAFIYILPTIGMALKGETEPGLWPHKKINLGLDLQGGMHLILEVDTDKAVESTVERINQELRSLLKKKHIRHGGVDRIEAVKIEAKISGSENINRFRKLLDKDFKELRIVSEKTDEDALTIILDLPDEETAYIKKSAAEQALEKIRNRIDQFGVSEPDIRNQGENRILIQLPGVKDTDRAKGLIGKTALLEFKLLDETHDVDAALKGDIPPGSEILYEIRKDSDTRRVQKTPFLVKKRTLLSGDYLTEARVQIDNQYNEPHVSIKFNKKGGRLFERITGENVKKRLAIVLDGRIYSAPVIQEKISGGEARITGRFTHEEAHDLAIILRAGALPAPVHIIEERTVGPSLGIESIRKGILSIIVGGILVIVFMIIYYKGAGLIADIALILNIVLIAGGLAAFQATLTLPGIAGIILTIGMAVDANVLIFERIREEMGLGRTPRSAVDAGFERATLTILDANVTTLIAALVLFQFGTGAVKGFAVTLSLGVLASLFTALFVSRMIFDYFLSGRKIKQLSI